MRAMQSAEMDGPCKPFDSIFRRYSIGYVQTVAAPVGSRRSAYSRSLAFLQPNLHSAIPGAFYHVHGQSARHDGATLAFGP